MNDVVIKNAGSIRKASILGAIGAVIGILLTAPESNPRESIPVRLAL